MTDIDTPVECCKRCYGGQNRSAADKAFARVCCLVVLFFINCGD